MGYIVFKYSNVRDLNVFADELASEFSQADGSIASIASKLRLKTEKAIADMTIDQLVSQLLREKGLPTFDTFKTKKDIATDKDLISKYGAEYLGYVVGSFKKDELVHMLDTERKVKGYAELRNNTFTSFPSSIYAGVTLSAIELREYVDALMVSHASAQQWVDNHSKETFDAFSKLPVLIIKHNF